MQALVNRAGWVLAAIISLAVLTALAGVVRGGPLDPPGPPGSTDAVREPGTPIAGPTTISSPGHYYLTRNISVSGSTSAIAIASNDVDLDLGGFTITGGGNGAGGFGIYFPSVHSGIGIHNGSIRAFQFGLAAANAIESHFDQISAYGNARGIEINNWTTLTNCVSSENTETGIHVMGSYTEIRNCVVVQNTATGISVDGTRNTIDASEVRDNDLASFSGWADVSISGFSTVVKNSVIGGDAAHAVLFPSGAGGSNVVIDTVCRGGTIDNLSGEAQQIGGTDHQNLC